MIIDHDFEWVYITNSNPMLPFKGDWDFPKTKKEYLEHWGKWAIFGKKTYLNDITRKIDPYVEERYICNAKYLRRAMFWAGFKYPAMVVYSDDREKERVWKLLSGVGVTKIVHEDDRENENVLKIMSNGIEEDKLWIYESETIESWYPGGYFVEKMIEHRGLSPERGQNFRERMKRNIEAWINHLFGEGSKDEKIWNVEQMIRELSISRKKTVRS